MGPLLAPTARPFRAFLASDSGAPTEGEALVAHLDVTLALAAHHDALAAPGAMNKRGRSSGRDGIVVSPKRLPDANRLSAAARLSLLYFATATSPFARRATPPVAMFIVARLIHPLGDACPWDCAVRIALAAALIGLRVVPATSENKKTNSRGKYGPNIFMYNHLQ